MAKISLDDKQFNNGVDKSERSFSSFGKKVTGVIAGLGITKLAKDTVRLGIDTLAMSETSGIAWETLLGSQEASKKMLDDIAKFAATTPFEKMGVDNMAKQLHNAGFQGKDLFTQLTKFGDIGGAFGVQAASLEEMVRQYSQVKQAGVAYTEDLNILQDRGIPIYKAIAEELGINTAEVKKWASEGKISADIYQKALDNIASSVEGGMAKQSKSFTGMVSTFKDGLAELAAKLSEPIFDFLKGALETVQPIMDQFIKTLGEEGLIAAISELSPGLGDIARLVGEVGKVMAAGVKFVIDNKEAFLLLGSAVLGASLALKAFAAYQAVVTFITGMVTAIKTFVGAAKAATVAQTLLNMVLLANPIGLVIAAIGALVGAFLYFWTTSEGFREFWINLWETIKMAFQTAWDTMMSFFTETIPGWIEGMKSWFMGLPEWFGQLWENVKQWFVTKWNEIWTFLTETIPMWIENIVTWWNELPSKIGEALGFALASVVKWGYDLGIYLQEKIPEIIENVNNWFSELPGKIWNWLLDTYNKAVKWGSDMKAKADEAARNFIERCINWFNQLPGRIWTWLTNTINKVIEWKDNMVAKGEAAAKETVESVVDGFSDLPSKIYDIGKNMVEGLWNGIKGMKDWISNKVSGFMGGIVEGAKKALGIHSPSRVFARQIGEWIPPGIGMGIDNAMPELQDTMDQNMLGLASSVDLGSSVGTLSSTSTTPTSQPINLSLNIENFYNNNNDDVEELTYRIADVLKEQKLALGILG